MRRPVTSSSGRRAARALAYGPPVPWRQHLRAWALVVGVIVGSWAVVCVVVFWVWFAWVTFAS